MKALALFLIPLVVEGRYGPVVMPGAGTQGMDSRVFDGMKKAQEMSLQRRQGVEARQIDGEGAKGAVMVVGGSFTTLRPVRRQNTRTTTVTEKKTVEGAAETAEVLVTATVTEIVNARPTEKPAAVESKSAGGAEAQAAKETVTKTVTAPANAADTQASKASKAAGAEATKPAAEASSSSSPAAAAESNTSSKSPNAEASSSSKSPNAAASASKSTEKGASETRRGKQPQGTGGVVVPLSAVVPENPDQAAALTGTDLLKGGFTYKGRVKAKARRRLVRTRDLKWLWL